MKCLKCFNDIQDEAKFCPNCGAIQEGNTQTVNNVQTNTVSNKQKSNSIKLKTWQKGVIICLLLFVVILLGIVALSDNNNQVFKKKTSFNSRTIMVYMVGSNLESECKAATGDMDFVDPTTIDLTTTNILIFTGGTKLWHNQVRNDENAIYKLTENGFEKIETYSKNNMADGKELTKFLNYAYENYQADQYNLILYDHGSAFYGAIKDDFTNDLTTLSQFDSALSSSLFYKNKIKLNSVSFRTCLMGSIEVAKVFSKYADYLVASEEEIYLGYSINVFGNIFNYLTPQEDEIEFGKKFIKAYNDKMNTTTLNYPITYSIIKLDEVDNLVDETNKFFKDIDVDSNYQSILRTRASIYQFPQDPDAHYAFDVVDLKTLVNTIGPNLNKSVDSFNTAFEKAVVYNYSSISGAEGLTIYFPYSSKINTNYKSSFNFLKDYSSFFTKVYNKKINSGNNSYKAGSAGVNVDTSEKTVEYDLPEGVKDNYKATNYFLFRKNEEHPNYYYLVVNSTDAELDGNKVKFKLDDKMIYGKSDNSSTGMYLPRLSRKNQNGVDHYSYVVAYLKENNDKYNPTGSSKAKITYNLNESKPSISTIQLDSRNETVAGIYEKDQFKYLDIYGSQIRLLDNDGKLMDYDDWESAPELRGFSVEVDDMGLEYKGIDDGEWFAVFFVYDIYDNVYSSDLIKVGK